MSMVGLCPLDYYTLHAFTEFRYFIASAHILHTGPFLLKSFSINDNMHQELLCI